MGPGTLMCGQFDRKNVLCCSAFAAQTAFGTQGLQQEGEGGAELHHWPEKWSVMATFAEGGINSGFSAFAPDVLYCTTCMSYFLGLSCTLLLAISSRKKGSMGVHCVCDIYQTFARCTVTSTYSEVACQTCPDARGGRACFGGACALFKK